MTVPVWTLEPGAAVTRAEVQRDYGGGSQGGILPCAGSPNILLYSDPAKGHQYGYEYDGWADDGRVFLYTGEGQIGDQQLSGGNLAVAAHVSASRALRLFVAVDKVPNSAALIHEYIGEFVVDTEQPYLRAEALDREQQLRSVLVFRLRPVGVAIRRPVDASRTGDAPAQTVAQEIPLEAFLTPAYKVAGTEQGTAQRRESELTDRFHDHLRARGHTLCRLRIQPPGELKPLFTDTFDRTTHTLYEAKGSATRHAVRQVVGQLLDYKRHIDDPELGICALLPSRPSDDLIALLHSVGAGCTWPEAGNAWPLEPGNI